MSALPKDFVWHQSGVGLMLRCGLQFYYSKVARLPGDHQAQHFAAQLGTADHAGCEVVLHAANAGEVAEADAILGAQLEGFDAAVQRASEEGTTFDHEKVERALERLEHERLPRLVALASDPRVHAIEWLGIEDPFNVRERNGRLWKGTRDAWGIAREYVAEFGAIGREPVDLHPGDGALVDWKAGALPPFDFPARVRSPQLGLYTMTLPAEDRRKARRWRTFLGLLQDLDRPKAPTDDDGKRIPKHLPKRINPAFREAIGAESDAEAKASKKRPRGVSKWLEQELNPEFERACARPKGPVFREAVVRYPLVLETVSAAIAQAEAGIWTPNGVATGACALCPYQSICTQQDQETTK